MGSTALTHSFDVCTRILVAVRVRSKVDYAQVNSEKACRFYRYRVRHVNRGIQVKRAITIYEIDLPLESRQIPRLILAVDHWQNLSPLQRQQTHMRWAFPAQQALIVGHGTFRVEGRALAFITLETFHDFANGADCHLRRQAKAVPQRTVAAYVDRLPRKDMIGKPYLCRIGRSGIIGTHGSEQCGMLSRRRYQFELQGEFHRTNFLLCLAHRQEKAVGLVANLRFLCQLTQAVSTKEFL